MFFSGVMGRGILEIESMDGTCVFIKGNSVQFLLLRYFRGKKVNKNYNGSVF